MREKARPRYSASTFIDAKINKLGDWRVAGFPRFSRRQALLE